MYVDACATCVSEARCLETGHRCSTLDLSDPWSRFRYCTEPHKGHPGAVREPSQDVPAVVMLELAPPEEEPEVWDISDEELAEFESWCDDQLAAEEAPVQVSVVYEDTGEPVPSVPLTEEEQLAFHERIATFVQGELLFGEDPLVFPAQHTVCISCGKVMRVIPGHHSQEVVTIKSCCGACSGKHRLKL